MALLRLPVELVGRIIKETMPEGFESFVFTCKTVYHATGILLEQHNNLRRRYRDFKYQGYGDLSDEDTCRSSLQLISRIAEESLIARYIVSADFKEDCVPEDEETLMIHIKQMTTSSSILSLLENSPYLQRSGADPSRVLQYLISQYKPDDGDFRLATTFLLTLLPNVTDLALPTNWEDYVDGPVGEGVAESPLTMSSLLDAIVARANDPFDSTAGLSNLTSLLPSAAWGYENRWELSTFTPFLSINSMRNFCAGSCIALDDNYTGAEFFTPEYESFGVGLETVELVGACVNDIELRKFLSRMPRLRSFKLSFETKWHGCGHDWDAIAVMKTIEEEVGENLEDLSFSILNCIGDKGMGIKSMNGFKKLKELELDVDVLYRPPYQTYSRDGPDYEFENGQDDGSDGDEDNSEDLHGIPRLGDLLPPTIEKLCLLVCDINIRNNLLDRLFSNLAEEKDEKIPNLKEIVIRHRSEGSTDDNSDESGSDKDPTRQRWKIDLNALRSSVQVEFVEVDGIALPYFMRDFCTRHNVESM